MILRRNLWSSQLKSEHRLKPVLPGENSGQYALAKNARSFAGSPQTMHLPAAPF